MNHINFLILIGILAMATIKPIHAQPVVIKITDIDISRKGDIIVMLFTKEGFPKQHLLAKQKQQTHASTESLSFTFDEITYQEFAIKVLHDEDSSGEVSKSWTGIFPSEGLGFSNGATLFFGPPSFKRAKLSLIDINEPIVIPVAYP